MYYWRKQLTIYDLLLTNNDFELSFAKMLLSNKLNQYIFWELNNDWKRRL